MPLFYNNYIHIQALAVKMYLVLPDVLMKMYSFMPERHIEGKKLKTETSNIVLSKKKVLLPRLRNSIYT